MIYRHYFEQIDIIAITFKATYYNCLRIEVGNLFGIGLLNIDNYIKTSKYAHSFLIV